MKIIICGDFAFYEQMLGIKKRLENMGNDVMLPQAEAIDSDGKKISSAGYFDVNNKIDTEKKLIWQEKKDAVKANFDKITWCDAVFVLNLDKDGITNYINPQTLMDMTVAFHLNKPIYLWQPIPEKPYKDELASLFPVVINEDLRKI
jgi:uncharacterized protein YkuJ